jgi:hypothetical protein
MIFGITYLNVFIKKVVNVNWVLVFQPSTYGVKSILFGIKLTVVNISLLVLKVAPTSQRMG